MQIGFYFNQTRCTGCGACQVACKDWHDIPAGPEKWISTSCTEKGKFPNVFVSYLISACWHCQDPVCVLACPVNSISKRNEDGIVTVDSSSCIGNTECDSKCLKACPYKAPQFNEKPGAKMRKCDYCLDRKQEGKLPICVEACPTRAIDSGFFDDLKAKYGNIQQAEGFKYSERVKPSVVFKPKLA
jgi:anaerobic dimethyl sulfoxide reductase subunit B (iron-sulfur subunit)